jgi:hypothetical protein
MRLRMSGSAWLRLLLAALLAWAPVGSALHVASHASAHAAGHATAPAAFAGAARLAHAACDVGAAHVHAAVDGSAGSARADGPLARQEGSGSACAVCLVVAHGAFALGGAPNAYAFDADTCPSLAQAPIDVAVAPLRPYASRAPPILVQST